MTLKWGRNPGALWSIQFDLNIETPFKSVVSLLQCSWSWVAFLYITILRYLVCIKNVKSVLFPHMYTYFSSALPKTLYSTYFTHSTTVKSISFGFLLCVYLFVCYLTNVDTKIKIFSTGTLKLKFFNRLVIFASVHIYCRTRPPELVYLLDITTTFIVLLW